eukprot:g2789.t1
MGAGGSVATDLDSFEATRKACLRDEDRVVLRSLLDRHADVRTLEVLQERLQQAKRGSEQYAAIEREYVNWIARQVAMRISEQALQDAILSLGGNASDVAAVGGAGLAAGSKESKIDEGKRK